MSLLPPGWKIITVDGVSTNTSGTANIGAFVFAPSQSLIVSGVEVAQSQITAPIDPTTGAFSADLPASNDPAVSPQGTYYTVYEKFPEGRAPYAIFVDYATPGGTVNLFDLAPVVPPPDLVSTIGPRGPAGQAGVVQSIVPGANVTVDNTDPANPVVSTSNGGGDVVGPSVATDGAVALYDGTTGKLLKDGTILGSAAYASTSAFDAAGSAAAAQSAAIAASLQKSANLSDLSSVTTARTNLGLGSAATRNASGAAGNLVALDNTAQYTKNQSVAPTTLTYASTVTPDASASNNFELVLTGNCTLANPTNLANGMVLNFAVDQDATGGHTLTLGSLYQFPGGTPTFVTTANGKNFFSGYYDGSIIRCGGGSGDGSGIITTSGVPSNAVGADGDYAIDPTAQLLYGPKASGAWPAGVSYKGATGSAGSSLTQKVTTIASTAGVLPAIDLSLGFEVYKLTLTENITSGPTFTNAPASGVEAAPRIDVTQAASGTAWTMASPAPGKTAGGAWVNSLTLGAKESLVLVVDSTATITKMFPSGVLG